MSERQDETRVAYRQMEALDQENKRVAATEKALEERFGITFPRCPVCGGRRRKPILGRVCEYCGVVGR